MSLFKILIEFESRDNNLLVLFCTKNNINATITHQMIINEFGNEVIKLRRVQKIAKTQKRANEKLWKGMKVLDALDQRKEKTLMWMK